MNLQILVTELDGTFFGWFIFLYALVGVLSLSYYYLFIKFAILLMFNYLTTRTVHLEFTTKANNP